MPTHAPLAKNPTAFKQAIWVLFLFFTHTSLSHASETRTLPTHDSDPVFASINDRIIRYSEFQEIFYGAVRYKYYHGEVPRAELVEFQRQVGSDIVEQILIYDDALNKGIQPNMDEILKGLNEYEDKYFVQQLGEKMPEARKSIIVERLKRKDILDQMEAKVRDIPQPSIETVSTFYENHPEKFTEPKRVWVSILLINVPPSSVNQQWIDAKNLVSQLRFRIIEGENFEELAKQFSTHASSVNGGNLGYLHEGMLDSNAQQAVDKLEIDEISEPVRLLEGFAIFKLNGIQPAKLKPFEEVQQRATELTYRDQQDQAWQKHIDQLKQSANIHINEELYASPEDN